MDVISYKPLFWLLLLIPLLLVFSRSLVNRPKVLKVCSFLLRGAGLLLLVLALCRPYLFKQNDAMHLVFLVDVSESVDLGAINQTGKAIEGMLKDLSGKDSYSVFYFADRVKKSNLKSLDKDLKEWQKGISGDTFRKSTKIAQSLESVKLSFPANKIKRILLFSDGMDTGSGLEKSLQGLREDNIDLQLSKLGRVNYPEVAVVSLKSSSETAYTGEIIRLTAKVVANHDATAKLRFLNRGIVLKEMPVKLTKDTIKSVSSDFIANEDIRDIWTAEVVPDKDHFPINNQCSCSVEVKGNAKVLAIHRKPNELSDFVKALKQQGIEVEARGKFGLPTNLPEMLEFDAIIVVDLPATDMSTRQMNNLKRYVVDFGRGFIMTGSENSFGLGGYYKTPVEDVLPVVSRYEKEKEQPSLAMVLVIDKSGSMGGMPIELAREAAKATVELLSPRDQIGVVAFDGQARSICDMTSAVNSVDIQSSIDSIDAGGGTNMYPAMEQGKEMLETVTTKIKHMIILSDGQSQPGDFENLASEMGDLGMTVSTVALGGGAARDLMRRIAELGRGRYYETNDYEAMPKIFTKETMEASRSAIKEEPFTPVKVGDADYLQGIDFDNVPFLLGYVMTRMKPTVKIQLLTENGDPLLASGRFGLGKTAAFTSDVTKKWAGEWLDWKNFGKFWSQIVRAVLNHSASEGFFTKVTRNGEKCHITIRRQDETGKPLNKIKWQAQLFSQGNRSQTVEVKEIGLGLYSLSFSIPSTDSYTLQLTDKSYNKSKTIHRQKQYPREYLLDNSIPKEIEALKLANTETVVRDREPINTREPVLNTCSLTALLLILGGILLRRI